MGESSFRLQGEYLGKNILATKLETTRYNTAKFSQPQPNMAAPMHQVTAHEKVVNSATISHGIRNTPTSYPHT